MSEIADRAAFEAAVTEAELDEAETDQVRQLVDDGRPLEDAIGQVVSTREVQPTPLEQSAEQQPPSGEPTPDQLRKLEQQVSRHLAKVHEIMGGHTAGLEPCPECGGVGLGQGQPQPKTHPLFEACGTCNGYGDVLTGSLKQGEQTRACPDCRGRGYLEDIDQHGNPVAPDQPQAAVQVPDVAQLVQADGEQPATAETVATRKGVPAWMGDPSIGG